jgi:hypothetical protein
MPNLNVDASVNGDGSDHFEVKVGTHGRVYPLSFSDLMNLIRHRCGHEQKKLEYKPK